MSENTREPERGEEEDVFLDANDSPQDCQPAQAGLRRSTRKRKSVDSELDNTVTPKNTGKRHRPLGTMGGLHRSPEPGKSGGAKERARQEKPTRPGQPPKASMTVTTDPPTENPSNDQLILLGGIREVLKEELKAVEDRLSNRLTSVESNVGQLQGDLNELEKRMNKLEKPAVRSEDNLSLDTFAQGTNRIESPVTKLARYWKSRKSLRMWPIKGDADTMRIELQKFLSVKLGLGEDVLADMAECSIRRIPAGRKKSGIAHEVLVEFPTVDLRDVVRGAAYNLASHPDSGIRLEIPHHLMANFKALNTAS